MDLIAKQVPQYLIIGRGRVARHFFYYFTLLNIHCSIWNRNDPPEQLDLHLRNSTHILVLLRDQAIEQFILNNKKNSQAFFMHFSGSLISSQAYGTHPLMTFNQNLYTLAEYKQIPFIIDHDCPDFSELLPGIPNPHYRLNKAFKPKYHAFCVLAGNFSCILWQKLFYQFQHEFNLPEAAAHPFLKQQMRNLIMDPKQALTGPLTRNDYGTLEKNITALEEDAFKEIYLAFINCYRQNGEIFQ